MLLEKYVSLQMFNCKIIYFSYFYDIISYGILLSGRAADNESHFHSAEKAIRAIYNLRRRDS